MPTQYVPATVNTDTAKVGTLYHLALSDGVRTYGYMLQNRGGTDDRSALNEATNITDRDKLIQFSSPNLIDQHLVSYPRVSQGDYSGGGLQVVFIDATKYFDSDLAIKTPGYLQLRPSWSRTTKTIAAPGTYTQAVNWKGDVWVTFSEGSGNVYSVSGGTTTNPGFQVIALNVDGANLWAGGTSNVSFTADGISWGAEATALNGAAAKWWIISQGTNGRFAYYTVAGPGGVGWDNLYKIDTNAANQPTPVAAVNQPQVPTGANPIHIVDLVAYQNGIAILSTDFLAPFGFDVWFHDGVNMTRIVRIEGYVPRGMCNALGDLYVGAQSVNGRDSPILAKIASGSYEIVARPGLPGFYATSQFCGQPRSGAEFVYWPVALAGQGLSTAPYLLVYDAVTGAISHLPNFDATDFGTQLSGTDLAVHRNAFTFGPGAGFAWQANSTTGRIQVQTNALGSFGFMATGWMVSGKFDFGTPGIAKRSRRIEVHHTPLGTGESITVRAYVDLDPLAWTPSLTPRPSGATVTNTAVGTDVTTLSLGNDPTAQGSNVGRSLIYAIQLAASNGAGGGSTTPKVIYTAIEIGGTWIWDLDLDCTSVRRLLNGSNEDPQGVTGKDLYYILRNAYENGTPLTLTLAPNIIGGVVTPTSYTVNIEDMKARAFGYVQHQGTPIRADEEWLVHLTLKQEAS
jgi:hypothetical protein